MSRGQRQSKKKISQRKQAEMKFLCCLTQEKGLIEFPVCVPFKLKKEGEGEEEEGVEKSFDNYFRPLMD